MHLVFAVGSTAAVESNCYSIVSLPLKTTCGNAASCWAAQREQALSTLEKILKDNTLLLTH